MPWDGGGGGWAPIGEMGGAFTAMEVGIGLLSRMEFELRGPRGWIVLRGRIE
jgi:hypothetical protein